MTLKLCSSSYLQLLGLQACSTLPGLCGARDQPQYSSHPTINWATFPDTMTSYLFCYPLPLEYKPTNAGTFVFFNYPSLVNEGMNKWMSEWMNDLNGSCVAIVYFLITPPQTSWDTRSKGPTVFPGMCLEHSIITSVPSWWVFTRHPSWSGSFCD